MYLFTYVQSAAEYCSIFSWYIPWCKITGTVQNYLGPVSKVITILVIKAAEPLSVTITPHLLLLSPSGMIHCAENDIAVQ